MGESSTNRGGPLTAQLFALTNHIAIPDGLADNRIQVNLPNYLTLSRIASVPLLIWLLSPKCMWFTVPGHRELAAATLFILASITDGVDGYLARSAPGDDARHAA